MASIRDIVLGISFFACCIWVASAFLPIERWFYEFWAALAAMIAFFVGLPWLNCFVAGLMVLAYFNHRKNSSLSEQMSEATKKIESLTEKLGRAKESLRSDLSEFGVHASQLREKVDVLSREMRRVSGVIASNPEVQARGAVQDAVANVMNAGRS